MENRGEGVFVGLKTEAIKEWLTRGAVTRRSVQLLEGFKAWQKANQTGSARFPGAPFIMLHSLSQVFATLAKRMAEVPGLKVQLFVHVGREGRDTRHDSEILREYAPGLKARWPGAIRPMLYYDPRSLDMNMDVGATWHAKVAVVDDEQSLVTSANFTEWAQQRNVEAGVLIRSADFARQLRQQFEGLIQSRAVLEVPGFR